MESASVRVVFGMRLPELPDTYVASRDALQRVAVHIVARASVHASGRIALRATPGGFGTTAFGDDVVRVRVAGGLLVHEFGGDGDSSSAAISIDGASLRTLAEHARVDLAADLYVGHDTPPVGDIDEPLAVDGTSASALGTWWTMAAVALDRVVATADPALAPSATRLWPEHFDVALDIAYDAAASSERRVNLGGSPGDGFHASPYLYVGPWTADRPGEAGFWNAPFGAVLGYDELRTVDDPDRTAAEFFHRGLTLLAP